MKASNKGVGPNSRTAGRQLRIRRERANDDIAGMEEGRFSFVTLPTDEVVRAKVGLEIAESAIRRNVRRVITL